MSRAKNWCFTINNYTQEDGIRLQELGDQVVYILYGHEVGENGTPHLQGFVSFKERKRLLQVKAIIGATDTQPHLEVCRNISASIVYCKKDGNFVEIGEMTQAQGKRSDIEAFKQDVKNGLLDLRQVREKHSEVYARHIRFCLDYIQDHSPPKALPAHPLRQWQQDLNGQLILEPDDRTITFVVDETGNSGKTWFAHYYEQLHESTQVLQPGRKADMAFVLDPTIKVLFIDAPRSKQGEFIQYDFLEDVKNGYVFSSKYESRTKQLGKVHVCVMMNEQPDMTKLSADRYNIINV